MIDKYRLDDLRLESGEKGELARWVIQLQTDLDSERRKAGNSPVIGVDLASGPDRTVEVLYFAPPGYVMVPKRLIAENGAKSKQSGLKVLSILQQHQNRRPYNANNLMIDLETMGKKPNAPIVSIGAVFFNPQSGELGPEFYAVVSLESAMESGAVPDGDTILWWMKQSAEARAAICIDDVMPISDALSELDHFIVRNADNPKYMKVWGNGANFDNVILRGAYERAGQLCPWAFWNDHDVRTIVTLGRTIGFDPKRDMPFDGDMHNALADARHQAKYVSAIWQKLIPTTSTDI